jgi:aryl-alcohol dehydrogenase-like predicted oxidoreductase
MTHNSRITAGPAALAADPVVSGVAAKHGATPSQIALAWLLQRDERIQVIPGTSSVAHLEENLAAAGVALDGDDMAALDEVEQTGDRLLAATYGFHVYRSPRASSRLWYCGWRPA